MVETNNRRLPVGIQSFEEIRQGGYLYVDKTDTDSDLKNYWASSGATSLLPKFVDDMELKLREFDPCTILRQTIETSDVTGGGAELFLYQSGYLTIKDYQMGVYILGFPNNEVKQALYETVLPALSSEAEQ